jgi:hypothetical protein
VPEIQREFPQGGQVVVTLIVSVAIWAYIVFVNLAYLRRISGGLAPFDLRPFGYDAAEAQAFLAALSQIGRDYYNNVQLPIDTLYPATYAMSRALLLGWVTAPGRTANRPLPFPARLALIALPFIAAAFDYLENHGIATMLASWPRLDPDQVAWTSFWTQAKSLAGLLSETTCLVLVGIAFVRWQHRRRQR